MSDKTINLHLADKYKKKKSTLLQQNYCTFYSEIPNKITENKDLDHLKDNSFIMQTASVNTPFLVLRFLW